MEPYHVALSKLMGSLLWNGDGTFLGRSKPTPQPYKHLWALQWSSGFLGVNTSLSVSKKGECDYRGEGLISPLGPMRYGVQMQEWTPWKLSSKTCYRAFSWWTWILRIPSQVGQIEEQGKTKLKKDYIDFWWVKVYWSMICSSRNG